MTDRTTSPLVFVSGPYTTPDPCINTRAAIAVGAALMDLGYAPQIPHLSHFWHTVDPRPYEDWLRLAIGQLVGCDFAMRMPGESPGADREMAVARDAKIEIIANGPAYDAALAAWNEIIAATP